MKAAKPAPAVVPIIPVAPVVLAAPPPPAAPPPEEELPEEETPLAEEEDDGMLQILSWLPSKKKLLILSWNHRLF